MKLKLIFAFSLLLFASVASAQSGRPEGRHYAQTEVRSAGLQASQTLQLTVDEAVRRAVEHNPDLAVVRYGTQVEEARLSESESAYVPVFSFTQ